MKNTIITLLTIVFSLQCIYGQVASDSTSRFFERIDDTMIRFHLDPNYYLVDKDCEFKNMERVAGFKREINKFHGDFADFDIDGQVILEGHYVEGRKEGLFTAYHPNNQVKWEVTFEANRPKGYWNYYYPDGKPFLSVSYADTTVKIISMWDRRGRLQIKNGSGRYEFRNPIDGFSEYGFSFYRTKGRLKDGIPAGLWEIYYENNDVSEANLAAEEFYRNGIMQNGYYFFTDTEYKNPMFSILPYDNFYRAEALLSKSCSFDEFTGFTLHLSRTLNTLLQGMRFPNEKSAPFTYSINVKADGTPMGEPNFSTSLSTPVQNVLDAALNEIEFYVPSFKNDKYIDDTLTISGRVEIGQEGQLDFHIVEIARKEEHND